MVQKRPAEEEYIQMVFHEIYFSNDRMIPHIVRFILT